MINTTEDAWNFLNEIIDKARLDSKESAAVSVSEILSFFLSGNTTCRQNAVIIYATSRLHCLRTKELSVDSKKISQSLFNSVSSRLKKQRLSHLSNSTVKKLRNLPTSQELPAETARHAIEGTLSPALPAPLDAITHDIDTDLGDYTNYEFVDMEISETEPTIKLTSTPKIIEKTPKTLKNYDKKTAYVKNSIKNVEIKKIKHKIKIMDFADLLNVDLLSNEKFAGIFKFKPIDLTDRRAAIEAAELDLDAPEMPDYSEEVIPLITSEVIEPEIVEDTTLEIISSSNDFTFNTYSPKLSRSEAASLFLKVLERYNLNTLKLTQIDTDIAVSFQ